MRLLAILFAATSLFGAQRVSLHPIAPTSTDSIALHIPVTCQVTQQSVQRVGPVIKVNISTGELCDPPLTFAHVVELEPLPPGEYRVEVLGPGGDISASTSFVVRNGGRAPFIVHPSTIRSVPAGLRMWIGATDGQEICSGGNCSAIAIHIGNSAVTNIQAQGTAVTFSAPALPVGLYDVTLIRGDVATTSTAAVYAFEESDPSVFERILFPVLDSISGANGSSWVSEAIISNPKPWFVENSNSVIPAFCVVFPCTERLSPGAYTSFTGQFYPHGIALLAARAEAPGLGLSLRVRDTSREADGFGAEVPVVREKDMFRNTTITLLGVPRDPRYRVKVRMYALEPFFLATVQSWRVAIVKPNGTKSVQFLVSEHDCPNCPDEPAYVELDLPPGAKDEFSTVYITPPQESFAWAFASVTNNVTQQVTIVTPNGKGGEP